MERIEGQVTDSQVLAKQILPWITCAKRPLTTLELQHALAVEIDEHELDEENLSDIEDVISVCAGLVTVDEQSSIVRLVHYTTQEYFERTQKTWFPHAETDIAETCLTYLSFDIFATGLCTTEEEFERRLQLNALYDYAAQNWGYHARAASTKVEQSVLGLLESEAKVSSCTQALLTSKGYYGYTHIGPGRMTGLHLAAYFGLKDAIIALLKNRHDPNLKDVYGRAPLSWAARNGHEAVVKLLLEKSAELESKDKKWDQTPLLWAARNGHEAVVKLLLEKGPKLESKDQERDQTPLSWAVKNGHEAVVKLLLEKGAKLESKDKKWGHTLLSWAARNGHEAVVKLLLEKGAELESKDYCDRTPLAWAAESGHEAVVELLLEKGAELESKNYNGRTPLSWAAEIGHEAVVKLLLEKGAELESKNNEGLNAAVVGCRERTRGGGGIAAREGR
jgi:ankyrin repeat protein